MKKTGKFSHLLKIFLLDNYTKTIISNDKYDIKIKKMNGK